MKAYDARQAQRADELIREIAERDDLILEVAQLLDDVIREAWFLGLMEHVDRGWLAKAEMAIQRAKARSK